MTGPEDRPLPPDVPDLVARIRERDQNAERGPDRIAQIINLGQAAMELTGDDDMESAIRSILEDTDLHDEIFALFAEPEFSNFLSAYAEKPDRLEELREEAEEFGSIHIRSLFQGEILTLVYESAGRFRTRRAIIEVMRNQDGDDTDMLSLAVISAKNTTLHSLTSKILPGQIVYLGYMLNDSDGSAHRSELMRGTTPAWITGLHQTKKRWYFKDSHSADGFSLQQIYYGRGFDRPLFTD